MNMNLPETFIVDLLSEPELDYELLIRRIRTKRSVPEKQRLLQHELLKEQSRPTNYSNKHLSFETERDGISTTLESITTLILEFVSGTTDDRLCKQAQTKLQHARRRVQLMPIPQEDNAAAKETRDELQTTCLLLEADLRDRILVSPPVPLETQRNEYRPTADYLETTAVKYVPVYKWGLSFSGEPSDNLTSFLERVEELSAARGVSQAILHQFAVDLFHGNALIWYRSVKNRAQSWTDLVAMLKEAFLPVDYDELLWQEINKRTQQKDEPISIYVAVMETLFSRLTDPPSESRKVKCLLKQIRPVFTTPLALQDIDSVERLVVLCKRLENAMAVRIPPQQRRPDVVEPELLAISGSSRDALPPMTSQLNMTAVTPTKLTQMVEKKCFNCGGANHFYQHCTQKRRVFCYRCGVPNVKTSACPTCQNAKN